MNKINLYTKEYNGHIYTKYYDAIDNKYVKKVISDFKSSFFVEAYNGKFLSTNGKRLIEIPFDSVDEYKESLKEYKNMGIDVYNDIGLGTKFISENFQLSGDINEMMDYDSTKPRVVWYDIETEMSGDIDTLDTPNEIRSIAVHHNGVYKVFGFKEKLSSKWHYKDEFTEIDINYVYCEDEVDLLNKFIKYIRKIDADVLIGYNSEIFDDAYVVNRIKKLGISLTLSPFDIPSNTYEKSNTWGSFQKATVIGINLMDYKKMLQNYYKKMSAYGLDFVSKTILKRGKKTYSGNLNDLYENDYKTFLEYNIVDVEVMVEMEKKLTLLPLVYILSTIFYTNFESIESMTNAYDSILYNALNQGFVNR